MYWFVTGSQMPHKIPIQIVTRRTYHVSPMDMVSSNGSTTKSVRSYLDNVPGRWVLLGGVHSVVLGMTADGRVAAGS